jgi:cyclopropane fatty-acyl-phospholipid synthase-like methyltransferase
VTADYFDQWYADIARSDVRQQLFTEALGVPAEVGPSNLVPLDGLREIAAALRLPPDGELADFACGRGGPGMWIARELGAELVGIDFSPEAIAQASERRMLFGLADRATFAVGTLEDSGLAAGSVDGLICIDAFQFGDHGDAVASEMRRVLRPGGRVVLTCWEAVDPSDDSLPERLRISLAESLTAAGFTDVMRTHKPEWMTVERALWERGKDLDPADDPAVESVRKEAERTLATWDRKVRVMATAIAP